MTTTINASTSSGLINTADTSGILQLQTANTAALTIDASQNVGIGTASPSAKLNVVGTGDTSGIFESTGTNNAASLIARSGNGTTSGLYAYARFVNNDTNAQDWRIGTYGTNNLSIVNVKAGTTPLTLDTSGNLGVGISPATTSRRLVVYGSTNTSAATSLALQNSISGTGTTDGYTMEFDGTNAYLWNYENSNLIFGTSNTERARIDSSGNLLVGTSAVGAKLYVLSNLTSNNGFRIDTPSSFTATNIFSLSATAGSTSWYHIAGNGNGGSQTNFIIYGNGNMVNANNSYGAVSDVKLKENIVDASPKLADLMQVKVRNYNLIGETTRQIGVVAQELETVFPSMIDETVDKDQDGNSLGTTTKQVKYSVFVPMLIKAIQEQQALITQLQADVAALKGA